MRIVGLDVSRSVAEIAYLEHGTLHAGGRTGLRRDELERFAEREEIGLLSAEGVGVREIARRIGRSASTVSRELKRNAATRSGRLDYRASVAQWKAELFARRPKPANLATNPRLVSVG